MKLVCVTGMHRSGTSLIARLLNLLGVDLGNSDDLLGPAPDNPKGFWEHQEIKALNDRLLAKLGGSWEDPPTFNDGWEDLPDLRPVRRDASDFVEQFRSAISSTIVGWKDPRLSLTLPFWRTVTKLDRTVLCLRDPAEVAASLGSRNGIPAEQAADLWVRYTLAAWCNDPERIAVSYRDALQDPRAVTDRLVGALGLSRPDETTIRAIEDFVEPDLRHHEDRPLDGPRMRLARTVHGVLRERTLEDPSPILHALYRGWHKAEDLEDLTQRINRLIDEQDRLEGAVARRDEQVARREEQIDRLRESVSRRDLKIETRTREHRRDIESRTREHRLEREKLQARISRLEVDLEDTTAKLDHSDTERQEAVSRAERAERAVDKLQRANEDLAELRRSNRDLKKQVRDLEETERHYRRLRGRRIVRLGLAVAGLFRPLFRFIRRMRSRSRSTGPGPSDDRSDGSSSGGAGSTSTTEADVAGPVPVNRDTLEALRELGPITVIVPIHNALEHVRACVDALIRNTTRPAELLLVDDASTDPDMAPYLQRVASLPHVRVLTNQRNLGFTRSVNRGFAESDGDVVVLNSDTEVTPRWLENLSLAAYRATDIATVTAISNNAGAFSVPKIGRSNPTPAHLAKDEVGLLVSQRSSRIAPETPTGNGFCMYIKRTVIDDIGVFDAEVFPRGYGEENDLSMRAIHAGYRHVVDDATFVFHVREASFGDEKQALATAGRQALDERYPDYTERVRAFVRSDPLRSVQERVAATFAEAPERVRRRVLYVIHAGMGGAPQTNQDLMQALDAQYECFILTSDTKRLVLQRHEDGRLVEVRRLQLEDPIELGQFSRADYARFVTDVLVEYAIDLVHVRHLIKHTFDLPRIAADLAIPTVISFHDFYLSCPTVHLLDNEDRFCAGQCTPGQGRCRLPNEWLAQAPEPLKHGWVYAWRDHVRPLLERADALVTTTASARDVYLNSFPRLEDRHFEVIEHGRNLDDVDIGSPGPVPGGTVRILVPGNLDVHKGAHLIRALAALDEDGRLEFHLLGRVKKRFRDLGVYHGTYERENLAERVAEIAPSFVGLFSVCGETYSHTLTEAWSCGLPVIASNLGAIGERVRRHGRGWVIDVNDPVATYERILAVADDPAEYWRVRSQVTTADLPRVSDMAHRYDVLYRSVLRDRRRFEDDPEHEESEPSRPLQVGLVVVRGRDRGRFPGSVHVRTLRRYQHDDLMFDVAADVIDAEGFLRARRPDPDVLYIQRNAVPVGQVDEVIDACSVRDVPLVIDLDDNLLEMHQLPNGDEQWAQAAPSLQQLVAAADLVTVSTEPLRDVVQRWTSQVVVVPNHLDAKLWLRPYRERPARSGGLVRILYMGTSTHAEDLAPLRSVITRFDIDHDIPVELEVIGGEPQDYAQDWYTRLPVPSGTSHYPRFARWLASQAGRWDIAVAPLADDEFNRYKSDLKFLEYSALGLPGVYSEVPAYRSTVRHGETGLLSENSTDAWFEHLDRLVNDAQLRRELGRSARRHVIEERTLDHHVDDVRSMLTSLVSGRKMQHAAA